MLIYSNKLTRSDLDAIAEHMHITLFDTDPEFGGARRRRIRVSLRPGDSSSERWRKVNERFDGSRRRVFAISWDGHYVFFSALLALDPDAEIKSVVAHWKGREDFHDRAPETGDRNWGAPINPVAARHMSHEALDESELRRIGEEIAADIDPNLDLQPTSSGGGAVTYVMQQSTMRACPHFIMVPTHYRQNGTCKCNDPAENVMAEWGYTWDAEAGQWN
jgi:hypothetical protein